MATGGPTKMPGWLRRWDRAISGGFLFRGSHIVAVGAGLATITLAVVTFVTVVGRRSPWGGGWLVGGYETSELLMAIVSVSAISYCWYVGGHIRIGLVRDRSGPRTKAVLDAVSALLGIVFVVFIAWGVWEIGMGSLVHGKKTMALEIPVAPFQIAFSLAVAHFVLVLLRSVLGFLAGAMGRRVEHEGLY